MAVLFTVGHGTLSAEQLGTLLESSGLRSLVDVRSVPASRRHPQFARTEMERWMPEGGVRYRWEPDLGGFRRARADSAHVALRHPSFRGYADHMESLAFTSALASVLEEAKEHPTTVMCSETLWWRCHRRLIADAAVLLCGFEVSHIGHDGRCSDHRLTDGVRAAGQRLVYDAGQSPLAHPGG
ncbi:MAG: DUF488 family protein [Acidimicrobiales bacterium]